MATEPKGPPTIAEIKNLIRKCITTVYCEKFERQCIGKNTKEQDQTLKILYLANNMNIWEDLGDDFSKLWCQIPNCLTL